MQVGACILNIHTDVDEVKLMNIWITILYSTD